MRETKYLAKNIGLLTISQFGTKILTFFLVPLYTNVLTTAEYGTYDLYATTVGLIIPIMTINISESVLRFSLDGKNNLKDIFSIGLKYSFIGSFIALGVACLNHSIGLINSLDWNWYYLPVLFIITALNTLITYFARGIDKVKETAISGVICSIVMILLNLIFLLVIKIGLHGYFLAQILSMVAQIMYLFVTCRIWDYMSIKNDKVIEREMYNYSTPMIANSVSWWVNNSSDRFVITTICGVATNGIYSVAYKIPSILNVFQTIFFQAWTLSAVKDFDPEDKNYFFTNIYNLYNCCMVTMCSVLIITTKIIAKVLYAKDFYEAWKFAPFLTFAIIFGSMSGFLGAIFSAVKDTKAYAKSTIIGAVLNIVFNIVLVLLFGPIGAAISTAIAFIIVWLIRLIQVKKYIRLHINYLRDVNSYFILIIQISMLYILKNAIILYSIEMLLLLLVIWLYKKEVINMFRKILLVMNRKKI